MVIPKKFGFGYKENTLLRYVKLSNWKIIMNKLKNGSNKILSIEEIIAETQQQLGEVFLNIKDSTNTFNLLSNEAVDLIDSIIANATCNAFKIGYAGCADHIRKNSSKNQVKEQILEKIPSMNDTLEYLNGFLDLNVKHTFKEIINEKYLGSSMPISDRCYLKFFLLRSCEASLKQTLDELTDINNKYSTASAPKIDIKLSKG